MAVKLKKLKNQTVVITGASSGIGLVTARMAAKRGASVVVAARDGASLRKLVAEIRRKGGKAACTIADVGREEDVRRIAQTAIREFGGFDTWVNNAGVSIYGMIEEISIDDMKRLFDTNFWGVIYGSRIAAEHFKSRSSKEGGAIINIGSTLSDRVVPIQGIYSTSKHAVKGFTDAFRMELEMDDAPISVTLIKPAAINTPYPQHAKNYMDVEPNLPPPVYAPEVVAETILHAAENPTRDAFAGGGGKAISALGQYAPRLADTIMETSLFNNNQKRLDKPARRNRRNGLEGATGTLKERGEYPGHVAETSAYTTATLNPLSTAALVIGGAGLAIAAAYAVGGKGNGNKSTRSS